MPVRFTLTFIIALAFAACGDSEDGSSNGNESKDANEFKIGIEADRRFNEFDAAERRKLCEFVEKLDKTMMTGPEFLNAECSGEGVEESEESEKSCEEIRKACIDEGPEPFEDGLYGCDEEIDSYPENCTATAVQYEDCMNAAIAWGRGYYNKMSCASLAEESEGDLFKGLGDMAKEVEACKDLLDAPKDCMYFSGG